MANIISAGLNANLTTDLGGLPAANSAVYITKGTVDYNNAAGNDLSANDMAAVNITPQYGGNIGADDGTAPLKVVSNQGSTGKVSLGWAGRYCYLQSSGGAGVIYSLIVNPARGGKAFLGPATVTYANVLAGILQVASSATLASLRVCQGARGIVLLGGAPMTNVLAASNGSVDLYVSATNIEAQSQGTVNVLDDSVTPTNLSLKGGTIAGGIGATTNSYLESGIWDLRGLTKPLTVTNRYARGYTEIWLSRNGPGEPTWTNKVEDQCPPRIVLF